MAYKRRFAAHLKRVKTSTSGLNLVAKYTHLVWVRFHEVRQMIYEYSGRMYAPLPAGMQKLSGFNPLSM